MGIMQLVSPKFTCLCDLGPESLPRWVSVFPSCKVGRAVIISSSQECCKALLSKGSLSSSTDLMGNLLEMQVLRSRLTYLLNQNVHVNKTLIVRLVCAQQFIRIKLDNICIVSDTSRNTVKDRIIMISDAPSPSVRHNFAMNCLDFPLKLVWS